MVNNKSIIWSLVQVESVIQGTRDPRIRPDLIKTRVREIGRSSNWSVRGSLEKSFRQDGHQEEKLFTHWSGAVKMMYWTNHKKNSIVKNSVMPLVSTMQKVPCSNLAQPNIFIKNAANIVMVMNAMELHGVTLLIYSQPETLKNAILALILT